MIPHVAVLERISPQWIDELKQFVRVSEWYRLSDDERREALDEAPVVVIKSRTIVDGAFLDSASKLVLVARAGTGLDNVDMKECTRRNISVLNFPSENAASTADLTVGLILMLVRNVEETLTALENKDFGRHKLQGQEMSELSIGLLGMGDVSLETARRLKGFGCTVRAWSPSKRRSQEFVRENVIVSASMHELLSHSHVLSVHASLSSSTQGLLDHAKLSLLPMGAVVVNTARGALIDDIALTRLLDRGHISKAAVDVLNPEPDYEADAPTGFTHLLLDHPRVLATPHIGALTQSAQDRIGARLVEQLLNFFYSTESDGALQSTRV